MPITRTYGCERCGHFLEVVLTLAEADAEPPDCPHCNMIVPMQQEFKPFAIGGSIKAKAADLAQTIAHEDYHVADIQVDHRPESVPKVRFKDQGTPFPRSNWGASGDALEQALAFGREARRAMGGSGVDILKHGLETGAVPDLIEASKKRAMKIW